MYTRQCQNWSKHLGLWFLLSSRRGPYRLLLLASVCMENLSWKERPALLTNHQISFSNSTSCFQERLPETRLLFALAGVGSKGPTFRGWGEMCAFRVVLVPSQVAHSWRAGWANRFWATFRAAQGPPSQQLQSSRENIVSKSCKPRGTGQE